MRKSLDYEREIERVEREIERVERQIKNRRTPRIERFNEWLFRRKKANEIKFYDGAGKQNIEQEIKRFKNAVEKLDYGIGKQEERESFFRREIESVENTFNEIAKQSKIEWFRNSWMTYTPQNLIQEIKYWLS